MSIVKSSWKLWVPAVAAFAGAACFSSQHRLSQEELDRLAYEDPEYRSQDVRVTQRYASQESAPPPGEHEARRGGSTTVFVSGSVEARGGGSSSARRSSGRTERRDYRSDSGDDVTRRDHRSDGDGDVTRRDHRSDDGDDVTRRDHRSDDGDDVTRRDHRSDDDSREPARRDHRDDGDRDSGRDTSDAVNGEARDGRASARRILIAAAAVGGTLALTRGTRYEGYVDVDPAQPVHLIGPHGEFDWVPLDQLEPEDAQWASEAYIDSSEGHFNRRSRAPLTRRTWTYSMYVGGGQIPLIDASPTPGFLGRFDVGYFLTHQFGIGADVAFGWTNDDEGNAVIDSRLAAQLQLLPFETGRIHGGFYGQVGGAARADDGVDDTDSSALLGVGGMLQLDLTTTLALSARGGGTYVHGEFLPEAGIGISVY